MILERREERREGKQGRRQIEGKIRKKRREGGGRREREDLKPLRKENKFI